MFQNWEDCIKYNNVDRYIMFEININYIYMRQNDLKRKYDPELDRYVKKHIYGEGISDVMKSIGSRVLGKTTKELAKKAATKAAEKAGDKIIELLSKKTTCAYV